jgi:Transposase IS4
MVVWHALVLGMALHPYANKNMYWQTGAIGTTTFPNFGRFIRRKRWLSIKKYLHLESNIGKNAYPRNSGEHRLWQVRTLIPMLKENFKKYYCPGGTLTVDERTIPIRNRMCPIRICNPKKPYNLEWKSL